MDEMEKLKRLIEHWIEHNAEHEKTYMEWSAKALGAGNHELSEALRDIADQTKSMEKLFLRAMKAL